MDTRANIAQLSILLSDFDNNVLAKCSYDNDKNYWLFDGELMGHSLLKDIRQVLSKMERIASDGTYAMGLRDE